MAVRAKTAHLKIRLCSKVIRGTWAVVDLFGELFQSILDLFGMSGPNDRDRWVIPIAIGLMMSIIAFVVVALLMQ
jgi:hypothetical protein